MRHSVRARFLQTLVCAGCALALPASATATGSPVHIDPASPVAKEYALPLDTARGAAPESGQKGKLFGSGIRHAGSATAPVQNTPTTVSAPATPVQTTPTTVSAPATPVQTTPTTVSAPATIPTAHRPRRPRHHSRYVITVTLTRTTPTRQVTPRAAPAAYRVLRPGSGTGLLWMAVAAAVVIALGSAGGLALRRRR